MKRSVCIRLSNHVKPKSEKCEMEQFIHVPVNLGQALLDLLSFAKRMTEMTGMTWVPSRRGVTFRSLHHIPINQGSAMKYDETFLQHSHSVIAQHWRNWTRKGSLGSTIACFCRWVWKQAALHQAYQDWNLTCIVIVNHQLFQHQHTSSNYILQLQSAPNQMREELSNEKFKMFVGTFWLARLEALSGSVGSGQFGCFRFDGFWTLSSRVWGIVKAASPAGGRGVKWCRPVMVMRWRFEDVSDQRGTGYQLGSNIFKWCSIIPFVLEFNKERMVEEDIGIALQDRAETWQHPWQDSCVVLWKTRRKFRFFLMLWLLSCACSRHMLKLNDHHGVANMLKLNNPPDASMW